MTGPHMQWDRKERFLKSSIKDGSDLFPRLHKIPFRQKKLKKSNECWHSENKVNT